MEKAFFLEVARAAMEQMPPETRFRPEDAQAIARHRELLLSWTDELVQGFYDTLFAHPPTRAVFREGERPEREETLRNWWRKTVGEDVGEDYFAWMAYVGLVHVVRKVKNSMMLAMVTFVMDFVDKKAGEIAASGGGELLDAVEALQRLMGTVAVIIADSYDHFVIRSLFDLAGIEPALLERMAQEDSESLLKKLRG